MEAEAGFVRAARLGRHVTRGELVGFDPVTEAEQALARTGPVAMRPCSEAAARVASSGSSRTSGSHSSGSAPGPRPRAARRSATRRAVTATTCATSSASGGGRGWKRVGPSREIS
jgi:hypothetical protein